MTNNYSMYHYQNDEYLHPNARATIKDRNGFILATNIKTFDIHLNCNNCIEPISCYKNLARFLNKKLSKTQLNKIKTKKGFIVLKQHLTPKQKQKILLMGFSGTEFVKNYKRFYPYGKISSHLLGYVDYKNHGCAGIEMGMNSYLKNEVKNTLYSTVDIKLQCAVYDVLRQGMLKYNYIAASAVVIDSQSAEVLAVVSFPSFNANSSKTPESSEMFNHFSQGLYEVGSVAKIFNTALALDSKKMTVNTKFDVTRPLFINNNFIIKDLFPRVGHLSVADIFRHSSNIGSALMALKVGKEEQKKFLRKIGLLDQFFVKGLPPVPHPKYPSNWTKIQAISTSFGYAHTASALQLVATFNGIVNNGIYRELSVIKGQKQIAKQIVSKKVSSQIRALMHYTVTSGSGRKAWLSQYYVAGKTGSSNVLEKTGYYNSRKTNSCFVAFVSNTLNRPKYLVYVHLIEPKGIKETRGYNTGGWNASVLTKKIISNIANIKALPPNKKISKRPLREILKIA